MNTRHNNKDPAQDEPQNYSNSFGSRQDEDEWLRQHGASGFSGFSGSDSQKESKGRHPPKTGVKLAESNENTTSGKYSYTHDDLIDPDE